MASRNPNEPTSVPLRESSEEVQAKFYPVENIPTREQVIVAATSVKFAELAAFINEKVADSPDKTHALRVLKDAAMWTTQAIVSK